MSQVFSLLTLLTIILSLLLHQSECFVTQLPKCGRYNANFSVSHNNKYFKGTIGKNITNTTRKKCALNCALHLGCLFFNLKLDGTLCELMTSFKGEMTSQPGWDIIMTSLKDTHNRGPLCRYIGNPCDGETEVHCEDTCKVPGFKCKTDKNIAKGKRTEASSFFSSAAGTRYPKNAVDGNDDTFWASEAGNNEWLLVDLARRRLVGYFWWTQLPETGKQHWPKMKPMRIRVGDHDESNVDGNEVCVENVDHTTQWQMRYACTNGAMYGRYVVLQKGDGTQNEKFFVSEIKVFALDW